MTDSWSSLEGVTLWDQFQLQTLLSETGDSACFLARFADRSQSWGWLRLALIEDIANDRQLPLWRIAAGLSHPNLVQVWETGHGERGVTSMAYLLVEPADEDLASVVQQRPLNQVEARETLLSVAQALSYLHSRSLVHGRLELSSILAVGDHIKLSSHAIEPSAEAGDGVLSAAADLRALGDCVHAMFTQSSATDLEHLSAIPQPFRDIIRGCYRVDPKDKWTAQRVVTALDWPPVTETPAVQPVPQMAAPPPPAPRHRKRISRWVFAPVWVAVALLIMLLARKPQPVSSRPALPPARSRVVSAPNPTPPPVAAAVPAVVPAVPPPAPPPIPPQTAPSRIWRVISYTYTRAEDAAKRVGEINRRFPQLQAERFFPNDSAGPYFVALGGRMTRTEAVRLRERAISSGLPSDTFVRNFKK